MTLTKSRLFWNRRTLEASGPNLPLKASSISILQAPIMPLGNHPKKLGGRPRKHSTAEAATRAKKESDRRRYQQSLHAIGPADFIAYEPPLHPGIPADTPPEIGLRTSLDVRIPQAQDQDHNTQGHSADNHDPQRHEARSQQPNHPPNPPPPSDDPGIAEKVREIRMGEREYNIEQEEFEAEVAQILAGLRSANTTANLLYPEAISSKAVASGDSDSGSDNGRDSQHPCLLDAACMDDPIRGGSSLTASHTPNKTASIQRSRKDRTTLQTPAQQSSSPSLQLSNRSNSSRSPSFPSPKSLLSQMRPMLPGLPTNSAALTPRALQGPLSIASSPPPSPPPIPSVEIPASPTLDPFIINNASPPVSPVSTSISSPIGTPTPVPTPTATASPVPRERTAIRLAKQLRSFQGCTHEQHQEADRSHQEHHQRPDVHSECSSLQQITTILRGGYDGGTPLPDVLKSERLMKPVDFHGLDCQAAFEGSSPSFAEADRLPRSLCLPQHYSTSRKNRRPEVKFDIDSTCCFPTSLAFARQGIVWLPKVHPILNLTADIHFGLRVSTYTDRGTLAQNYVPLHKVPHYCFGTVVGMEALSVFVFFPSLYQQSDHEHSSYLSKRNQQLWYDGVLSPCMNKAVGSSNIVQHYPATTRVADMDSAAASAESFARKRSSREQLLKHTIQPQYLDSLWEHIQETIAENPVFHRFQGATLFVHAKNTKLDFMHSSLTGLFDKWDDRWSKVADPEFYNKDRAFVDLAKQVTSEDSALPYDEIPDAHEAEVFLWKKCCLEAYSKTRIVTSAGKSRAKGNPRRTVYPWATMRDTIGQTMFAAPHGEESTDGLIYSQFYALIKTPFDSAKVYVFDNDSVENLALDPGYIRSLQQEGGAVTFSKAVCEFAFLHSKKRAHANLIDNQWKSYGIREEHRISLAMMEEIYDQWRQWDLYDDNEIDNAHSPLPYYIIPTQELLAFLYGQVNKYCFLFEHVLAHTARAYSLPETAVMVIALRALRFSYGSSLLQRESLLYKDRWEKTQGHSVVIKEGLGMKGSMERHGLGWFLPKFNWMIWRLAPPHGENILVGNILVHEEYKRRWRAVKDLRDVFVRFNQAESWYDRYDMQSKPHLQLRWLEYLHVLNLEQFDIDIWKAMLQAQKRSPELIPEVVQQHASMRFCHREMRKAFRVDGDLCGPHLVTGNKKRFSEVMELFHFLFGWDDKEERTGWGSKPYRVILQKSCELVGRRLGDLRARKWMEDFFHLVRLTHWILPYPSDSSFIAATKTSQRQGLKGRMMWFSLVYQAPEAALAPAHWPRNHPLSLFNILRHARIRTFGAGRADPEWGATQLIAACKAEGLLSHGEERRWVLGRRSCGLEGFTPVCMSSRPPKLKMLGQIKGKSLNELEELMVTFSQEQAGPAADSEEEDESLNDGAIGVEASNSGNNNPDQTTNSSSTTSISDRSIFRLFARKR